MGMNENLNVCISDLMGCNPISLRHMKSKILCAHALLLNISPYLQANYNRKEKVQARHSAQHFAISHPPCGCCGGWLCCCCCMLVSCCWNDCIIVCCMAAVIVWAIAVCIWLHICCICWLIPAGNCDIILSIISLTFWLAGRPPPAAAWLDGGPPGGIWLAGGPPIGGMWLAGGPPIGGIWLAGGAPGGGPGGIRLAGRWFWLPGGPGRGPPMFCENKHS